MSKTSINIYGNWISQPTRAVLWALKIHDTPFTLKRILPLVDCLQPEYLAKFPAGVAPGFEELTLTPDGVSTSSVFRLTEVGAILPYLAETRPKSENWDLVYPSSSAGGTTTTDEQTRKQQRAVIHQWLHWQHTTLRHATNYFMFPCLYAMNEPEKYSNEWILSQFEKGRPLLRDAFLTMEHGAFRRRDAHVHEYHPWLCSKASATANDDDDRYSIADIVCYCELDQLYYMGLDKVAGLPQPLQRKEEGEGVKNGASGGGGGGGCSGGGGLTSYNEFPGLSEWLHRMQGIPFHDHVRSTLTKFGSNAQEVMEKRGIRLEPVV